MSKNSPATSTLAGAAPISITQRVYDELRQRIIRGDIPPGERLKVDALKALLQAGASPIREALSLLTSDQLVERLDHRGFRAAPASTTHFREILMLRCRLDDIALRNSISKGDTQWEERLVLAHHRLSQAPRQESEIWEQLHKAFHIALLQACDSPILLKFCDQLYNLNVRYHFLAGKSIRYEKRDVAQEHAEILSATLQRNADLACQKLISHYQQTGDFLADQFTASSAHAKTKSKSTCK
jgi:DNA-binding GntR family transcriptional regulator